MYVNKSCYHKTAAWLSLTALLMVFIAPIISQTLMRHEYTPAVDSQHHHSHAEPRYHTHEGSPEQKSSHSMDDHAACGYCVLFSHSPLLFISGLLALIPRFFTIAHSAIPHTFWFSAALGYHPQHPRAPPAIHIPHQYR